jgi:putative hydrolase of the HAD superfamily
MSVRYKAVFFDAGNTLLHPHPSVEQVCHEVFSRAGHIVEFDAIRKAVDAGDRYYEMRYWQDDSFWLSESEAAGMWVETYTLVAREVGINGDGRRLAHEIYNEFGFHHRWQLYPEVCATLQGLHDRGLNIGIISNWDSRLPDLCAGIGITKYLDFVLSSAVVGRMKPQPDIFYMALERAGVVPEEAIHVGDHYYADVLGSRSVGITPVLVDRIGCGAQFDCVTVHGLESLVDFVEE